jgi:hypothetical protein
MCELVDRIQSCLVTPFVLNELVEDAHSDQGFKNSRFKTMMNAGWDQLVIVRSAVIQFRKLMQVG